MIWPHKISQNYKIWLLDKIKNKMPCFVFIPLHIISSACNFGINCLLLIKLSGKRYQSKSNRQKIEPTSDWFTLNESHILINCSMWELKGHKLQEMPMCLFSGSIRGAKRPLQFFLPHQFVPQTQVIERWRKMYCWKWSKLVIFWESCPARWKISSLSPSPP